MFQLNFSQMRTTVKRRMKQYLEFQGIRANKKRRYLVDQKRASYEDCVER